MLCFEFGRGDEFVGATLRSIMRACFVKLMADRCSTSPDLSHILLGWLGGAGA